MRVIKYTAISLSLMLLAACSDDPEITTVAAPVIEDTERLAPVALEIPGVGAEESATREETSENAAVKEVAIVEDGGANVETIERSVPPVSDDIGEVVPTIDAPLPLLLSDTVQSRFASYQSGAIPMLDAVFYPLGWSTDGKFAYAIEPPDEAVGSYFLNIYIQDLVTDKILWKQAYQSEPESNVGPQSFAAYWEANEKTIKAQFETFSIVESEQTDLMAGPIPYEEDRLSYEVQKKLKGQPDFGNTAMVTEYEVIVKSASRGSKVVHKETYQKPISVLDVDVIGYLKGADPERVALLVSGVQRGWEGPPHVTWFKVIGTNLRRGFK